MKNLRIGSKLKFAFGACVALMVLLAGVALYTQSQLGASLQTLGKDKVPKLRAISSLDGLVSDYRAGQGDVSVSQLPADIVNAQNNLDALRKQIVKEQIQLDKTLQDPHVRASLANWQAKWNAFLPDAQKMVSLAAASKDDEAAVVYNGVNKRQYDELTAATDNLRQAEEGVVNDVVSAGDATISEARLTMVIFLVIAAGLVATLLRLLTRGIATPIAIVTEGMTAVVKGQTDQALMLEDRADEIGQLAKSYDVLRGKVAVERENAKQTMEVTENLGRALSRLADGDLISRLDAELVGPFAKLKTDFNHAASSLQEALEQVAGAAANINTGAGEVRTASDDLSHRTEQQAASLEETAAAMDEITATVRQTAERAGSANSAVRSVREVAEHSGGVVRDAVAAMGGIERTSNEISEIISVIDGIAFQTNLLALNAGVEAARAGDAGKGFAVVASEVRALAQRSADAAKDVKSRITASSEQVSAGVKLVGETGEALTNIIGKIGEVSMLVGEITSAAEQQSTGLQQVNIAVAEMDGVTQQNAAMVEEATAAARSLAAEADGLTRQIARFRTSDVPAAPASPVHQLQDRAASAARRIAKPAPRVAGNTALKADDDWTQF